jgi:GNAT superfamily N-acetyltransferase
VLYVDPDWWGSGAGQLLIELAHLELAESYDEAI